MYHTLCHLIKIVLLVLITLFSSSMFGQGRQGKPLDSNCIISLTSKKGILYNGIDNLMMIDSSLFVGSDTLIVKTNNGIFLNDTCNNYLCIPNKLGTMWLTIYTVTGSDTSMLGYKYFQVLNIPEPLLTINGRPIETPAFLSKNELMDCDSLGVYFSEDIAGSEQWMRITEFSLGYSYGGFYVSHTNSSNKITFETREIINRLGPDREISIRPTAKAQGNIMKPLPIYRIRIY